MFLDILWQPSDSGSLSLLLAHSENNKDIMCRGAAENSEPYLLIKIITFDGNIYSWNAVKLCLANISMFTKQPGKTTKSHTCMASNNIFLCIPSCR